MAELWKGSMDSFALIPHSVTENVSTHVKDEIICVDSQPPRCLRSCSIPGIQGKRVGELNRVLCLILLLLWLLNLQCDGVRCCVVSSILFTKALLTPWREHLTVFYSNDMILSSTINSLLLNKWWLCLKALFSCKAKSLKNGVPGVSTKICYPS